MAINWYPGHMAKARREMSENLSGVDVAIEVIDARAPMATRNPDIDKLLQNKPRVVVLNKADLADPGATKEWERAMKGQGVFALAFSANRGGNKDAMIQFIHNAVAERIESWKQKGANKIVRAMVVGIPNVGKSSVINRLSGGGGKARTGARPGVTRGKQWVRLSPYLELMDTPGMLWPRLDDEQAAMRLAFINAIRDEVLDKYEIALALLADLAVRAPQAIGQRYNVQTDGMLPEEVLEAIAKRRGYAQKGGTYDEERAAQIVVEEFRAGKLGRITLERAGEFL